MNQIFQTYETIPPSDRSLNGTTCKLMYSVWHHHAHVRIQIIQCLYTKQHEFLKKSLSFFSSTNYNALTEKLSCCILHHQTHHQNISFDFQHSIIDVLKKIVIFSSSSSSANSETY